MTALQADELNLLIFAGGIIIIFALGYLGGSHR